MPSVTTHCVLRAIEYDHEPYATGNDLMRERDIFIEAVTMDSGEGREAYLEATCAGDDALRARVDRLLAEHRRPEQFILDSPPTALGAADGTVEELAAAEVPGARIGRYKLLERIGEGGMGEVFLAQQLEPVRRKVALKVIKAGMDTRQVVARFEAERQALALMDHPNIAKVLDGGATETGRPYFVMELVQGVPITAYCDRNHLATRERLDLFLLVCQAVQHAHTKGIIHRDLKPSNVLVTLRDGAAVPKVIDFGIAKAAGQELTDKTLFTQFAQMIGTPLYMSPEQAGGSADVDTRSDVYSLGVLLYELLTGTTPFDKGRLGKAAYDEIQRIIRDEEPPKPSTRLSAMTGEVMTAVSAQRKTDPKKLGGLVRGELDWIVMRALEKDRTRRYETANGLAADVQRYLQDEPVHACPPSSAYQLRKFARRNKGPVLAAALVLLVLLAGIAGTAWQAARANRARNIAVNSLMAESAAREQAMSALESITDDVVGRLLAREPVLSESSRTFLRKILAQYESFAAVRGDWPQSRYVQAIGHYRVGFLLSGLGDTDAARASFDRAAPLLEKLAADFPEKPQYRQAMANSCGALARLLSEQGKGAESVAQDRRAFALYQQLAAQYPADLIYQWGVVNQQLNLAGVLVESGERKKAEAEERQAIALATKLADARGPGREPEPEHDILLVSGHLNLGILLKRDARWAEAEAEYRLAIERQMQLLARSPDVPEFRARLAHVHDALGQLLEDSGNLEESEVEHRLALDIAAQLAADFPVVPEYRKQLAANYGSLGGLLKKSGKPVEAEAEYRRSIAINRQLVADFSASAEYRWDLVGSVCNLASLLKDTDRPEEAELEYRRAQALGEHAVEEFPGRGTVRFLAVTHLNFGNLLESLDKRAEAEAAYRRAIEIQSKLAAAGSAAPEDLAILAHGRGGLGRLLKASGKLAEAETEYRAAIAIDQALVAEFPAATEWLSGLANDHTALGLVLSSLGRRAESQEEHRQAIKVHEKLVAEFPAAEEHAFNLGGGYCNLGSVMRDDGAPERALEWLGKAMAILTPLVESDSPPATARLYLRNSYWNRALTLETVERFEEALSDWDRAVELTEQLNRDPNVATMHEKRAMLLSRLGRLAPALTDYDKAIAADPQNHRYWIARATLRLYTGDDAAYRAECLQMLKRFRETDQREVGERVVKVCLLSKEPVGDPALLARLIDQSLAPGAPDNFLPWFRMSEGIAKYRAGDSKGALKSFTIARDGMTDTIGLATADAFLALAYHHLDRDTEAREAADRGAAIAQPRQTEIDNPEGQSTLKSGEMNWMYYLVIRRELDALLPPTRAGGADASEK